MNQRQKESSQHQLSPKGTSTLFATQPDDVFLGLFFDAVSNLICVEELLCGSMDGTFIYESELLIDDAVERALQAKAALVTVMHYSPCSSVCPMPIDQTLKQGLHAALEAAQVKILDYLVIGKGRSVSLISQSGEPG